MEELYKKLAECEKVMREKKTLRTCQQGDITSDVPGVIAANDEELEEARNDVIGVDNQWQVGV
jgi:hypothetical protein